MPSAIAVISRAHVRPWCAAAHGYADSRLRKLDLAAGGNFPFSDKVVDEGARHYDKIEILAGSHALHDVDGSRKDAHDLMSGRAFEAGEYNQAISLLTEAIERLPGGVGAYRTRGRAYVMTGQLAESIADFTRAIELNPKDAQLFRERAVAYMKSGLVDEATLDERTANRLDGKAD